MTRSSSEKKKKIQVSMRFKVRSFDGTVSRAMSHLNRPLDPARDASGVVPGGVAVDEGRRGDGHPVDGLSSTVNVGSGVEVDQPDGGGPGRDPGGVPARVRRHATLHRQQLEDAVGGAPYV